MSLAPAASTPARLESTQGVCVLTFEPLDVGTAIKAVGDDGAGATAIFIGTTRNSFQGELPSTLIPEICLIFGSCVGKRVTRLEYQAYSKLAIKTMAEIMAKAHSTVPSLIRTAIFHRLGAVQVGDPSVVVVVSSPHRKEAFAACELLLEEVKRKAQIWKREYYEGEREQDAEWKSNF
jgi:molybdopterin synthase catalytic subunit